MCTAQCTKFTFTSAQVDQQGIYLDLGKLLIFYYQKHNKIQTHRKLDQKLISNHNEFSNIDFFKNK